MDGRAARENGFVAGTAGCENGDEADGTIVRVNAKEMRLFQRVRSSRERGVFVSFLGIYLGSSHHCACIQRVVVLILQNINDYLHRPSNDKINKDKW